MWNSSYKLKIWIIQIECEEESFYRGISENYLLIDILFGWKINSQQCMPMCPHPSWKKYGLVILMWEEVLNLTTPAKLEYASKLGAKNQTEALRKNNDIYMLYIIMDTSKMSSM